MIRTERLHIYPASREQMEAMIASEQDAELKKAYSEMPEGCLPMGFPADLLYVYIRRRKSSPGC